MFIVANDLQRLSQTCGASEIRALSRRLVMNVEPNGRHAH